MIEGKAFIKKNEVTGIMEAGFFDGKTGIFDVKMEINSENDLDRFLEMYDLEAVIIIPQKNKMCI